MLNFSEIIIATTIICQLYKILIRQGGRGWRKEISLREEFVDFTSVDLLEGCNPDGGPDVDVSGHAGGPGEEPVLVVGGQLLGDGGLYDVNVLGDRHLTGPTTRFII